MIAIGILAHMKANPAPDHSGDITTIHNRIDDLERRIDNIGINFRTVDIDGSVVTPPQWVKGSRYEDSITDKNLMTIQRTLRD